MYKYLIFDADNSLASLGNAEQIKTTTGGISPLRITGGVAQMQARVTKLFDKTTENIKHELFDESVPTIVYKPTKLLTETGLNGIVVDTISHTFRQDMRILEEAKQSKQLEMQDWGKLERMYNQFISFVTGLPVWVIVNCHITFDKDQATGMFYYAPQLKGSTKDSIHEYFDIILFTKASKDGKKLYTWQTFSDASKFGKDRLGVLPPYMSQDFSIILNAYQNAGIMNPKILVIGESGTGKSKALQTINKG